MSQKQLLIELHYLPCIDYLTCLSSFDKVIFESHENFQKQSYRNRCYILTSNKVLPLVIPIKHTAKNIQIRDVQIDNSQNWRDIQWRSIVAGYSNSPYFEYISDDFFQIFSCKEKFLYDLNMNFIELIFRLLKINIVVAESAIYEPIVNSEIADFRNKFHPKKLNIKHHGYEYTQVFGKEFVPNLSILDLLFCEGNYSGYILNQNTIK